MGFFCFYSNAMKALTQTAILFLFVGGFFAPSASLPGTQKLWRSWSDPILQPSLTEKELNITGVVGRSVLLPCKVKNLQDKTVSWIRGRDLTVLTVDTVTYTGDDRFIVKHKDDTEDWLLQLRGLTQADEGIYDCQVNTYPKLSTKVFLRVIPAHVKSLFDRPIADTDITIGGGAWRQLQVDPIYAGFQDTEAFGITLKISGRPWIQVESGTTLRLTCEAIGKIEHGKGTIPSTGSNEEKIIGWNLDDVPVGVLFPEWKVNIQETWDESGVKSELTLLSAAPEDSGKITCVAPSATPASVNFNVKEEKSPKQHYLGLSNTKLQQEHHHHMHPVTSAVSGASQRSANSKFVILCTAVLVLFMLTNIAVCFHYLRKV